MIKKKHKFRSNFELQFAAYLDKNKVKFIYEKDKIGYIVNPKTYLPDFYLEDYGFYIETKGRLITSDRVKHLYIKKQHPEVDIRFVFINSKKKLYKGSPTTYARWCDKHSFLYADRIIPEGWLDG
tara:strand:- start:140 stop:514 length:375 start_codon:yes stop_codon:yes gene_type:complete